ncbi:MAG TPA: phosphoenolpyruvate--protein phosphotransferase [Candidatus Omnitrophota bacterium]|nr:phosphoenolpyruvate--protein phosphotransferase [Candidatus Omnitrophota bacterium]HPS36109.1 phosphoenolpyruvate--protein phosphotransferase [Candidatus Omnitrophota bacterium]
MKQLRGIGVSPGIASGKVFVLHSGESFNLPKRSVEPEQLSNEIARFEEALTRTRTEILGIRRKLSDQIGRESSDIFTAHLLILEDRTLIEDVIEVIKNEKVGAEYAFTTVIQRYFQAFSQINDEYLKERISDVRDVGRRLLGNLCGEEKRRLEKFTGKVIIVSHDLSPSDTASLDKTKVLAFVTEIGGPTSHTAILGRSLEIPAIVGIEKIINEVQNGDSIIVDGTHGIVHVDPDPTTIEAFHSEEHRFIQQTGELDKLRALPAETPDGRRITLAANIEFHHEVPSVISHGGGGVGLYRTEYFYMNRPTLPSEQEQYEAYRKVAESMRPHSVIIRTLDLGGDKFASTLEIPHEMNPYLGWRAIRFCLTRTDIFKTQLRAILRASAHGDLKIMYPLISSVYEIRAAREILNQAKAELEKEGLAFTRDIKVGAMIEIPSAALASDILAREVDFFSIGTNDLIQYVLAIDRMNEKIAYLYEPTHPAIVRLIDLVVQNGHKHNIWVGSCGEISADPAGVLLLLGLGIDEISASPVVLPKIKQVIRSIRYSEAQEIARKALTFQTGKEIHDFLTAKLKIFCKELLDE